MTVSDFLTTHILNIAVALTRSIQLPLEEQLTANIKSCGSLLTLFRKKVLQDTALSFLVDYPPSKSLEEALNQE